MEKIPSRLYKLDSLDKNLSVLPPITDKTQLNIEISSLCNARCIYCEYSQLGLHKKGRLIDEKLFYRITKEAFNLGVRDIGLYLSGDPFTNPKLVNYVEFLKKLGFRYVFLSTNGILCTPEMLEKLVIAGMDSIKFSIAGTSEESFYAHHRVKGFKKVYSNIKYAWEYRKKTNYSYRIFVFSLITQQNVVNIEKMRNLFSPYCDDITFVRAFTQLNMLTGTERLFIESEDRSVPQSYRASIPCPQAFNRINVTAEGLLSICCLALSNSLAGLTCVANLNEVNLEDAFYNDAFKTIREKHIKNDIKNTICNRCVNGVHETMFSAKSSWNTDPYTINDINLSADVDNMFPCTYKDA